MTGSRTPSILLIMALFACSPSEESESGDRTDVITAVRASPTGIPLDPREPTEEEERQIRIAAEALSDDPDDPDLIVDAALALEAVWHYNEAVELYTRGITIAPDDYRMYLGRAHRLIRLRQLEAALADLDRSVELDPYGFNSAYLRGLTLYLMGRFNDAADEYARCMNLANDQTALALAQAGRMSGDPRHCMVMRSDNRSLVAMAAWRYRALRRARRDAEAAQVVEEIPATISLSDEGMEQYLESTILPGTNEHYHNLILFYRGLLADSVLLDRERWGEQWPTVAYGAAVWFLVEGDSTTAVQLLDEVVSDPHWARFGHVAAELDLMKLTGTR